MIKITRIDVESNVIIYEINKKIDVTLKELDIYEDYMKTILDDFDIDELKLKLLAIENTLNLANK